MMPGKSFKVKMCDLTLTSTSKQSAGSTKSSRKISFFLFLEWKSGKIMVTGTQLQIVFLKYAWWYDLRKMKKILVQVGYCFFQEKNVKSLKDTGIYFNFTKKKNCLRILQEIRNQCVRRSSRSSLSLQSIEFFHSRLDFYRVRGLQYIYTQPSQGYDEVMAFNFQNRKANVELHELLNFDYVQSLIGKKSVERYKKSL